MSTQLRRVVVTGMGGLSPLSQSSGSSIKHDWLRLVRGAIGIRNIMEETEPGDNDQVWESLPSKVAARIPRDAFQEHEDRIFSSSDHKMMSKGMKLGLIASEAALYDAGLSKDTLPDPDRSGVSVGMAMVDLDYIAHCHHLVMSGQIRKLGPYFVPRILPNLAPGHISIRLGLRGPNHSASTACATGSHAIGDAFRMIQTGAADLMVCGGVEACINPLAVAGFCRARALTTKFNEKPEKASRPFDESRDGFVIGEGAGVLILESLDHALARGAGDSACDIYGEVVGYGMSGDAEHITAGREDGEGALSAMKMAFSQVGESAVSDLWCINAHATSTPRGDAAESVAIEKLLGCSTKTADFKPFLSSNKGAIGHLLGAAGSVESIFALLSLQSGILSPSANLDKLGFDIKSDSVEMLRSDAEGETDRSVSGKDLVLKNSFGFGGTNVSLLFKKFVI